MFCLSLSREREKYFPIYNPYFFFGGREKRGFRYGLINPTLHDDDE